jgi:hypothetical protein
MSVAPQDSGPEYDYYEEYDIRNHKTLGVFRHSGPGCFEKFLDNKWVEKPHLASYLLMGEPGADWISLDRAKEIMKSLGASARQIQRLG